MTCQSSDYPSMIRFNKDSSSSLFYWSREDKFIADGDGRGGVGPRTTTSPPIQLISAQTGVVGFLSRCNCAASPLVSFQSRYYQNGASCTY